MTSKQLIEKYKLEDGIYKDYYEHFQSKKTVLTHRACEKIANIEGITMKSIQTLNSELTFARFLVTMEKNDMSISSIGEADSKNCKNIYYGCMAEKRGIDRCVLKLIDAHEFAFSEVDFADHNEQTFEVKAKEVKVEKPKTPVPATNNQLILINELTKSYLPNQKKKLNDWLSKNPTKEEASKKIDVLKGVPKAASFQNMKGNSAT